MSDSASQATACDRENLGNRPIFGTVCAVKGQAVCLGVDYVTGIMGYAEIPDGNESDQLPTMEHVFSLPNPGPYGMLFEVVRPAPDSPRVGEVGLFVHRLGIVFRSTFSVSFCEPKLINRKACFAAIIADKPILAEEIHEGDLLTLALEQIR